jgi:putative DNA primase/helicase
MELAKPELQKYRADLQIWEAKHSGIKAKIQQLAKGRQQAKAEENSLYDLEAAKPQPPKIPKLLLKDISPEKLGLSLAVDWPVAGIVTSEAGVFFGSHAMSKDVVMRTLSLLNLLWDGGSISAERKVAEGYNIRSARLTMGLAIQEGTLREAFIRTGPLLRDTGFLARNLLCWPASNMGNRPFKEAPKKWPHLEAFNARIRAILNSPLPMKNGVLETVEIGLSDAAKQDWVEYHDAVELQLKATGDYFEIKDVAAKSADNVARLAGLFEKFNPNGGTSISQDSLQRAAQICAWHLEEARRFFSELVLPQYLSDAARLEKWLVLYSMGKETVSQRDAQNVGPVREKKRLDVALAELESLNRIKLFQEGRRKLIKINPMVMQ